MSSEGIVTLQTPLFSHTFLCDSSFFLIQTNEHSSENKSNHDV